MATITAVRSGSWSDTSHTTGPWPGGSTPTTKPGVNDDAVCGAYNISIDESITVNSLGGKSGGYFIVSVADITITTQSITSNGAPGSPMVIVPLSATINATYVSADIGSLPTIDVTDGAVLTLVGTVNGSGGDAPTVNLSGSSLLFTGSIAPGEISVAIYLGSSNGTINGNLAGLHDAIAALVTSDGGTLVINGNVTGGEKNPAINLLNNAVVEVHGAVVGGSAGAFSGTGTVTIASGSIDVTYPVTVGTLALSIAQGVKVTCSDVAFYNKVGVQ